MSLRLNVCKVIVLKKITPFGLHLKFYIFVFPTMFNGSEDIPVGRLTTMFHIVNTILYVPLDKYSLEKSFRVEQD